MPNRVQTLRSSVPGNMPQAATRAPGELWLNFADAHIGYIDASQTAQKLLAVRLFVSTAPYAVGDFVVYAGALYQAIAPSAAGAFTAANWSRVGTAQDLAALQSYVDAGDATRLPLAGGTLTGPLVLAASPATATQAANRSYVDAGDATVLSVANAANANANTKLPLAGGTLTGPLNGTTANFSGVATAADPPAVDDSSKLVTTSWFNDHQPAKKENSNRIINGDMRIDQRNNGAAGTSPGVYTIDRWVYASNQANKGAWQRANAGAALIPLGFGNSLVFTSSSAYTALAADSFGFQQRIEADMVSDFCWGTANAQPVTLSFLALSSLTGVFSGSIRNDAGTRAYPFTFSLPNASTWTPIVITIPGDTAGTWVMSGVNEALRVCFDLGNGANYRAAAGAWTNGDIRGATSAVSVIAANGASFSLTGVKLEIGSVATPFNRKTTAGALLDCQRYYQRVSASWSGNASSGANYLASANLPASVRASATLTGTPSGAAGFANAIGTLSGGGVNGTVTDTRACTATTTGGSFLTVIFADAEL
jgi:hypothetical protein